MGCPRLAVHTSATEDTLSILDRNTAVGFGKDDYR
jgi:hypothetical protein